MLGAVVRLEPNWEALPADVPPPVRTLLQSCLVKDRGRRVADISTALFVLDKAASLAAPAAAWPPSRCPGRRCGVARHDGAALVSIGALLAGAGVWLLTRRDPPSVVRTTITTSGSTALMLKGVDRDVAITPDGSRIVYRGNNQLLVRALNQLEPTVLSGLGAPQGVFISPDGQWVGFRRTHDEESGDHGRPASDDCVPVRRPHAVRRGADGTIVFATAPWRQACSACPPQEASRVVLTKPDRERGEGDHVWPEFLPGGEAVLFTITPPGGGIENAQIAVLDLRTGTSKVLIRGGSHAHYVPTGHLVYGVAGTLRAVAFDLQRLEVVGTPTPVLEGVVTTAPGRRRRRGGRQRLARLRPGRRRWRWPADRRVGGSPGTASSLPGLPPNCYRSVRVPPMARGSPSPLRGCLDLRCFPCVDEPADDRHGPDTSPLWTPDGQRIVYTSRRAGYPELFSRLADGTGVDERLLARANDLIDLTANGWSADGTTLLFTEVSSSAQVRGTIGQIALERPSRDRSRSLSYRRRDRRSLPDHCGV